MDCAEDEANESSLENQSLSDLVNDDDEEDIDSNEDPIKDPKIDEAFDDRLIRDLDSNDDPIKDLKTDDDRLIRDLEPDDSGSVGDEEQERNDSAIGESVASDAEEPTSRQLPVVPQPVGSVGRGRNVRKALDENNQELPPPQIVSVKPENGFYTENLRIARLPASYYRKREDPELHKQRRALHSSLRLINFRAAFNHISIIVDKDDSKEKGYQHACRRLEEIESDIKIDRSKSPYDIWSFGLYIYPVAFEKSVQCNLLDLIPERINNEEKRPFWFLFKRPPKFEDMKLIKKPPTDPDLPKGVLIYLDHPIYAELSSGALTSMTHYCVHKECSIRKRNRWTVRIHEEFFEIQMLKGQRLNNESQLNLTQIKYKIPLDIIDRAVVIHLRNNGFSLFINMKGNIHEFHRERKFRKEETDNNTKLESFKRQGIRIGKEKPKPLFSTICLRLHLRSDDQIRDLLEQQGKISQTASAEETHELIQTTREESLERIREVFIHLLDFFYKNRIHVCFGPIYQKLVSLPQLSVLDNQRFPTFIQSYSWTMLCNIGFRLQTQLQFSKTFINRLHAYSDVIHSDETPEDIDDRFYRLCLYLHRRSSEYIFLNLDEEIGIGIDEYNEKYRRTEGKKIKMERFNQSTSSTAYIPSVVLTPTTIRIRPLKLCKLNRVLREKRFGGVFNFALIELRDEAQRLLFPTVFQALKDQILDYLTNGFVLTSSRVYKYLHHSQSQVKCKQFWFYYHDETNGYLSHEDAYTWMGNFDKERVVAKHAARIALCFTSTDPTIQIPAETVTYVRDVKDATKKYAFSDGVGTISTQLRDKIQKFIGGRYAFSVLQIRYGGCKGTLSVDPNLDNQQYQLRIRDSMNKFTSDHDILELCKLSAPRALYLNRQDIVLLESRDIPHTNFLHLQNEDHFRLIRALLTPAVSYEVLREKILPVFRLQDLARKLNIVEEQFFMKLIITCAFNIIRELIDRTRIKISDKVARNMFGIVDEYGVLEYGQVFVQYSQMRENKLHFNSDKGRTNEIRCEILTGQVVITKNPCHHPGDLRVFEAVDHQKLRHLKDVVVFPQKGHRPHPNEISGSDLDGDEYVVIWHEDLIPKTPNETPYDYDSQEDPPKMTRPITRDDINQVVMQVSEQDCLGSLSNIHLAYVDKEGIKSKTCTELAGYISQEVDAAKTGKHPLTEEEIIKLREGLGNIWPDFMKARGKKDFYPSKQILGKLYRSAHRAVTGWSRAISNHGNPHHIHLALALTSGTDLKDEENDESSSFKSNTLSYYKQPLDRYIFHPNYEKHLPEIKSLYRFYQNELMEIISLYRFQDEIDLFCRCESMDASAGGSKKGSLEDSAAIEVQNLVQRIINDFYYEFDERYKHHKCCKYIEKTHKNGSYWKRIDCEICREDKLSKAVCAYKYSYERSNRLPLKSNKRILSFPWLFSEQLLRLRERNRPEDTSDQKDTLCGPACKLYLKTFAPKFKVRIPSNFVTIPMVEFCYEKVEEKRTTLAQFGRKTEEKLPAVPLLKACFVEILNDWLTKQKIFGNTCIETAPKPLVPESLWHELMINFLCDEYQPNVRLLPASKYQTDLTQRYGQTMDDYSNQWTNTEYQELQEMFTKIHSIAAERTKTTELTIWAYLDEYIILALQCIAIEKRLVDKWICP